MESPPAPAGDLGATGGALLHGDDGEYLLVISGERSWRQALPSDGELQIGRAPEAHVRIEDELVSRQHAQLLVVPDGLRITDLGSRHGTMVNGRRISGPQLLGSGDVITIGNAALIVHRGTRMAVGRTPGDIKALRIRLEEEIERCLRYQRELGLLVLRTPKPIDRARLTIALSGRLRLMDCVALVHDTELAVLLPEVGADEGLEMSRALMAALAQVASGWSCGLAISPSDGIDADGLLSAATAAAESAAKGTIAGVRDAVRTLHIGDREIVMADPAMIRIYDLAKRLARAELPILIRGETGAGKELAAGALHEFSERSGPLISINCAAIPEALAESELFGHERGAFSGAVAAKPGQLELGNGGTVFLDEVGDLPLAVQAKLLRVLENHELTRVGDVKVRRTDIRIVAATNRDLERDIEAGHFRRDLYYRLAAGQLVIPPLRDRPREIVLLAERLLAEACQKLERRPLVLSVAALHALLLHSWPGNVRELKHAMSYAAAAVLETGTEVDLWHLPPGIQTASPGGADATTISLGSVRKPAAVQATTVQATAELAQSPIEQRGGFRAIADEVRELERRKMVEALIETGGVQNLAAALIQMPLRTFATKLKRYAITADEWSAPKR